MGRDNKVYGAVFGDCKGGAGARFRVKSVVDKVRSGVEYEKGENEKRSKV